MPETEPTPWELMRVLRDVNAKVDRVVTKDMFQAESRRVDERLAEQARDIADERAERVAADEKERAAREVADEKERAARKDDVRKVSEDLNSFKQHVADTAEKNRANMRWLTSAILLPVALAIFALLTRGG
jgi:hypothetical protein